MAAPTAPRWLPAAIYTRVSTNKQLGRRMESCESQEAICRDFIASQAAAKGWEHVTTFTDPAYSGASMKRPGMDALKHAIAAGQVKVVVIFKLERVLRSTDEWAPFRAFLREHGCELASAMEDISETTALGRLKNNLLVSVSEYDRLNIAEKVRAKMAEQAKRGLWNGGSIPYGYDYDKNTQTLRPHPQEAAIVRWIYESAAALQTLTEIANRLNAEGLKTKERVFRRRDGTREAGGRQRFRSDGLRNLITNPIYRGVVRFQGEEYPGQHPALIPEDLWRRANASIREVRQRPEFRLHLNAHEYLLKGLCHCGHCGRSLIPKTTGTSNNARKHYSYYNCGTVMRSAAGVTCPVGRISAPALEGAVVGFMAQVSRHPSIIAGVLQATRSRAKSDRESIRTEFSAIEARLEKINGDLRRCVDAVAAGGAGALGRELLKRAEELRANQASALVERERKRQELAACEASQFTEKKIIESLSRLGEILPRLSADERLELVRLFIERIELRPVARLRVGEGSGNSSRILAIRIKVHLPGLIEGVDKAGGQSAGRDTALRPLPVRGVNFETNVDFTDALRGVVTLLAPFHQALRVTPAGPETTNVPAEKPKAPAQHSIVRAQHWQQLLESGQVANRVALARRFGITPGAVTRTLKMVALIPEIQNFLGALSSPAALRHFGMKRVGALAELSPDRQRAAFETIRRTFAQATPDLIPGESLKHFKRSELRADQPKPAADRIVALLRTRGPTPTRGISAELQLSLSSTTRCLNQLVAKGTVAITGNTRSRVYAAFPAM